MLLEQSKKLGFIEMNFNSGYAIGKFAKILCGLTEHNGRPVKNSVALRHPGCFLDGLLIFGDMKKATAGYHDVVRVIGIAQRCRVFNVKSQVGITLASEFDERFRVLA